MIQPRLRFGLLAIVALPACDNKAEIQRLDAENTELKSEVAELRLALEDGGTASGQRAHHSHPPLTVQLPGCTVAGSGLATALVRETGEQQCRVSFRLAPTGAYDKCPSDFDLRVDGDETQIEIRQSQPGDDGTHSIAEDLPCKRASRIRSVRVGQPGSLRR